MSVGKDTMHKKAISITGSVRNIGSEKLNEIFKKNTYMQSIYPSEKSRKALEVFCLYKGRGEYFDLSTQPITRASFVFGGQEKQQFGYFITEDCKACGNCLKACPQHCIEPGQTYKIIQEHCLHCGNCLDVCPEQAVIKLS